MSRPFDVTKFARRKVYAGYDYRTKSPVKKTGREWHEDLDLMTLSRPHPDDPGCVQAYVGCALQAEVYLT
jgi:hypothetical protein